MSAVEPVWVDISEIKRCPACQGEIVWARTTSGKAMPVDPEPHPDGNALLHGPRTPDGSPRVMILGKDDRLKESRALRMPHHATCPKWNR